MTTTTRMFGSFSGLVREGVARAARSGPGAGSERPSAYHRENGCTLDPGRGRDRGGRRGHGPGAGRADDRCRRGALPGRPPARRAPRVRAPRQRPARDASGSLAAPVDPALVLELPRALALAALRAGRDVPGRRAARPLLAAPPPGDPLRAVRARGAGRRRALQPALGLRVPVHRGGSIRSLLAPPARPHGGGLRRPPLPSRDTGL